MLATGLVLREKNTLHSCDNKLCCNPAHLRWGTQSENVLECIQRLDGRKAFLQAAAARGRERQRKISDSQIDYMLRLVRAGYSMRECCGWYQISHPTFYRIKNRHLRRAA
ncbi:helix-turn-helix domain-containing protein [Rhizobium ruizarguesonis]|uniref:helix-turn-helix domain-containing protein n=1 Tax=Rhizobium ruizarguesonis TaxID=2081791 RepID=UPI0034DB55A4